MSNNTEPWEAFNSGETAWGNFCPRDQEDIVRHFAPRVKFIALRLKARLPQNIELNELISSGTIGLMEAFGNFKPSLGNKFETYAENRIRGAMLDDLRRLDWFPRSLRRKVRMLDAARHKLETLSEESPTEEDLAKETGFDLEEVREGLEAMENQYCLSLDLIHDSVSSNDPGRGGQPFSEAVFSQMVEHLAEHIEELTSREQLVLSLYYDEELTMRETAEIMDITEGRVSQLHSQAVARLRELFDERYGKEPIS